MPFKIQAYEPPKSLLKQVKRADDPKYVNSPDEVQERIAKLLTRFIQIQADPSSVQVPGKAHCITMCDPEQLADQDRQQSNFEKDYNGENYPILAVKKYVRSDAGKEMNNPENIRPPMVLNLTTRYLMTVILDQDLVAPGMSNFQYQNQSYGQV